MKAFPRMVRVDRDASSSTSSSLAESILCLGMKMTHATGKWLRRRRYASLNNRRARLRSTASFEYRLDIENAALPIPSGGISKMFTTQYLPAHECPFARTRANWSWRVSRAFQPSQSASCVSRPSIKSTIRGPGVCDRRDGGSQGPCVRSWLPCGHGTRCCACGKVNGAGMYVSCSDSFYQGWLYAPIAGHDFTIFNRINIIRFRLISIPYPAFFGFCGFLS